MTPDGRTRYIIGCIRAAAAMYEDDAAAFLAEHDAHRRAEAAAIQMAFAHDHWLPADTDSISAAAKKDRMYGVAERLARLLDPTTVLRPRFVRVLPHEGGFLVRWQVGEESRSTFKATEAAASAAAAELRGPAAGGAVGKDTGGVQAPAGESTQADPDLYGRVHTALGDLGRLLPAHTVRLFTARVVDAVAPLVAYRPVWDSSLPPGGYVCNICGDPVESEPCREHAPEQADALIPAEQGAGADVEPPANEPASICDCGQVVEPGADHSLCYPGMGDAE
jgi:hypothetical protein